MAEMGNYCKAYLARQLRAFDGWSEKVENLRPETREENGEEIEEPRERLDDEDILYVQDDYVVTDGIFRDEHVVFDDVTDEWKRFLTEELDPPFEIPEYEPIEIQPAASAESTEDGDAATAE